MTYHAMRTYAFDELSHGQQETVMRTVMETDIVGFAAV